MSQKIVYLNVEVDEEDDQCGHVGGLEHEAAKWESTRLHSCAECVRNGEQKLDLWREENAGAFAERESAANQKQQCLLVPFLESLSTLENCPFLTSGCIVRVKLKWCSCEIK